MASGNYALGELLDMALGTPEMGVVNFNILHCLLRSVLTTLNIGEFRVHVDGSDFQWPLPSAAEYRKPADENPRKPTSPDESPTSKSAIGRTNQNPAVGAKHDSPDVLTTQGLSDGFQHACTL